MNCPFCKAQNTKVVDSRLLQEGCKIRRRRNCEECSQRFTTFEVIEVSMPMVAKNDGRRENFNREKLLSGIKKSCQKTSVSALQVDRVVENIEREILEMNSKEITTQTIGELMMKYLRNLHPVAYVRFASVYRTFKDIDEFVNDLKTDEIEQGQDAKQ